MNLPYVLQDELKKIILEEKDGKITETYYRMHNFKGIIQRYNRAAECVNVRSGKVLEVDVFVLDANELWDAAIKKTSGKPMVFCR